MSNCLRPHGLQHARPLCPSQTPRVYSNSCPLGQGCHPTISSSVIPFSSHLQSFPAAAAKSLQSCLTLCDAVDGGRSGSPVPGIPQARTLEWVAISFSNSFPASGSFPNESVLRIRWPKYCRFSFSISPFDEYSGLIFRMDWLDVLAVQGPLKSLLQHHSSKVSIIWHSVFFIIQLLYP